MVGVDADIPGFNSKDSIAGGVPSGDTEEGDAISWPLNRVWEGWRVGIEETLVIGLSNSQYAVSSILRVCDNTLALSGIQDHTVGSRGGPSRGSPFGALAPPDPSAFIQPSDEHWVAVKELFFTKIQKSYNLPCIHTMII